MTWLRNRWPILSALVGFSIWGASFYRAYSNLTIPAFGPTGKAAIAIRELSLRYSVYLAIGIGAVAITWAVFRRLTQVRTLSLPSKAPGHAYRRDEARRRAN